MIKQLCIEVDGQPQCKYIPKNCDDGNACTVDQCENDTCSNILMPCDDQNKCTIDGCNASTGCWHHSISCDDKDPCTADSCQPEIGCVHSAKCASDGLACTTDTCSPTTGECTYPPRNCNNEVTIDPTSASCYVAQCTEHGPVNCRKLLAPGALIDVCGGCVSLLHKLNITLQSSEDPTTSCLSSWSYTALVPALAVSAVAGIIVAAIIAALIVLAAGSYGTYELVRQSHAAAARTTTTNPLYQESDAGGVNPAYKGSE